MVTLLPLVVLAAVLQAMSAPAAAAPQDLFVEATLDTQRVAVHGTVRYRLRLYQAVALDDVLFEGPHAMLADVRALTPAPTTETWRDGRRYRVHERVYVVFPYTSGTLALEGAAVSGRASTGRWRMEAPQQLLTVQPIATAGAWLPARGVTISDSWEPERMSVQAGALLQRTIRVEVEDARAELIPPLQFVSPAVAVYPGPVRLENRQIGERLLGVREQTFNVVAHKPGVVVLSDIQLPWWDVAGEKAMRATLSARVLEIGEEGTSQQEPDQGGFPGWAWILGGVLLLAVPLHRLPWACWRSASRVRSACLRGDGLELRRALLEWGAHATPAQRPSTLLGLARQTKNDALRRAVLELDASLYGDSGHASLKHAMRAVRDAIPVFSGKTFRLHPSRSYSWRSVPGPARPVEERRVLDNVKQS